MHLFYYVQIIIKNLIIKVLQSLMFFAILSHLLDILQMFIIEKYTQIKIKITMYCIGTNICKSINSILRLNSKTDIIVV